MICTRFSSVLQKLLIKWHLRNKNAVGFWLSGAVLQNESHIGKLLSRPIVARRGQVIPCHYQRAFDAQVWQPGSWLALGGDGAPQRLSCDTDPYSGPLKSTPAISESRLFAHVPNYGRDARYHCPPNLFSAVRRLFGVWTFP